MHSTLLKALLLPVALLACLGSPANVLAQSSDYIIRLPLTTVSFAPMTQSFDFGNVPVGARPVRAFQFTNRSTSPLAIRSTTVSGAAVLESSTCPNMLAAGASCTVSVALPVNEEGPTGGDARVLTDASPLPEVLRVSAQGVSSAALLQVSPASKSFGNVTVGTQVPATTFTLKNTASEALYLGELYMAENSGYFPLSHTCPTYLEPSQSCTASVRFTPRLMGTAQSRLARDAEDGTQFYVASVSGTGVRAEASWTVSQANFLDVAVGVTSAPRDIGLTNIGLGALAIDRLSVQGDASFNLVSHTCGTSLAPGASCVVRVTVTPPDLYVHNASLRLDSNSLEAKSSVVQLYARPGTPSAVLTVEPGSLAFGDAAVGSTSAARDVVLKSTGNVAVGVVSYGFTGTGAGQFAVLDATQCVGLLAPGSQCVVRVAAAPTTAGALAASLVVTSNSSQPTNGVAVSARGVQGLLVASPSPLFFGEVETDKPASRTVRLSNTGTAALVMGTIQALGDNAGLFSLSGCSGQTIAAGSSCELTLTVTPVEEGEFGAGIELPNNGAEPALAMGAMGSAKSMQPRAVLDAFNCPAQARFDETVRCTAALRNTGPVALSVASASSSLAAYAVSHDCGAQLAVSGACTVTATLTPGTPPVSGESVFTTLVTVQTGAGELKGTASVRALASRLTLAVAPYSPVAAGESVSATHTVTNTGAFPVALGVSQLSEASHAGAFSKTSPDTCSGPLAPGASCALTVRCTGPVLDGATTARLTVSGDNGALAQAGLSCPVYVPVTASNFSVTPNPVAFPTVGVGQSVTAQATLTNRNLAPVALSSVRVSGANAGEFVLQPGGCTTVPAMVGTTPGTCTLSVRFTPTALGPRSALLEAVSTAQGVSASAPLAGFAAQSLVVATPGAVAFSDTVAGQLASASVTVKNQGPIVVSMPASAGWAAGGTGAGDFTVSMGGCANASLATNATCTMSVGFTPKSAGTKTATLTLAPTHASAVALPLSGVALPVPAPIASMGALSCASPAPVGTAGSACSVTLTNSGTAPLTMQQPTASTNVDPRSLGTTLPAGAFKAPLCGAGLTSLAPGASCLYAFNATILTAGTNTVYLMVPTNATLEVVSAQVQGAVPSGLLTMGTHAPTQVGVPSRAVHRLTNTGVLPLQLSATGTGAASLAATGSALAFTGTPAAGSACPLTLAPGASCDLETVCSTSVAGSYSGTLRMNLAAGATQVSGTVTCTVAAPSVSLSPAGSTTTDAGAWSGSGDYLRVTNTGQGPLTFVSATPENVNWAMVTDSANSAHCRAGAVLAAGDSCLVFGQLTTGAPSQSYSALQRIRVSANGANIDQTLRQSMRTYGVSIAAQQAFAPAQVGATPPEAVLAVTNTAPYPLGSMTFALGAGTNSTAFSITSHTCSAGIAAAGQPGSSCLVRVRLSSAAALNASTTLEVSGSYPQVVNGVAQPSVSRGLQGSLALSGSVQAPSVALRVGTHAATLVGASSTAQHTLANEGVGPVSLSGVTLANAPTGLSVSMGTCGATLEAGASCSLVTTFAPTSFGQSSATLKVQTSAGERSGAVPLQATLAAPVQASSLDFGSVYLGGSAERTFVLNNARSTTLNVTSFTLPAGVTRLASQPEDCTAGTLTLMPWTSCTVRLKWTPTEAGTLSGNATLVSNYGGGQTSVVSLTGRTLEPQLTVVDGSPWCSRSTTVIGNWIACIITVQNNTPVDVIFDGLGYAESTQPLAGVELRNFSQTGFHSGSSYSQWNVVVDGRPITLNTTNVSFYPAPPATTASTIDTTFYKQVTFSDGTFWELSKNTAYRSNIWKMPPGTKARFLFRVAPVASYNRTSLCFNVTDPLPTAAYPASYCFAGTHSADVYFARKGVVKQRISFGATFQSLDVAASHNAPTTNMAHNQQATLTLVNSTTDPTVFYVHAPGVYDSTARTWNGMEFTSTTCGRTATLNSTFTFSTSNTYRVEGNTSCTVTLTCKKNSGYVRPSTTQPSVKALNFTDGSGQVILYSPQTGYAPSLAAPFGELAGTEWMKTLPVGSMRCN